MSSLIATPAPRRTPRRGACALALSSACLFGALLLVALPVVSGELYKWTDANGVVHYSDAPPPAGQYQTRTIKQPVASAGNDEQSTKAPAESANCTIARGNLALLQGDQPVGADTDKDGTPDSTLTPEQRANQTKLAEAAIDVHCTVAEDADAEGDSASGSDSNQGSGT